MVADVTESSMHGMSDMRQARGAEWHRHDTHRQHMSTRVVLVAGKK